MKKLIILLVALVSLTTAYCQTANEYVNMGYSKHKLKDYSGAIADYTKAIEIDPNKSSAYYGRGLSKLVLGQKDSGCLDLSKAGELGYGQAYEVIKEHCN